MGPGNLGAGSYASVVPGPWFGERLSLSVSPANRVANSSSLTLTQNFGASATLKYLSQISVTLEPIMAEQATKGQRLLLIPGRASKRSR